MDTAAAVAVDGRHTQSIATELGIEINHREQLLVDFGQRKQRIFNAQLGLNDKN